MNTNKEENHSLGEELLGVLKRNQAKIVRQKKWNKKAILIVYKILLILMIFWTASFNQTITHNKVKIPKLILFHNTFHKSNLVWHKIKVKKKSKTKKKRKRIKHLQWVKGLRNVKN